METPQNKFSLWTILIIFVVILLILSERTNLTRGAYADAWAIPLIMALFGFIGAVIGGMVGGIIGLIGKLFQKNTFLPGLKYGAAAGFMGVLILWYLGCLMNGTAVCLVQ